MIRPLNPKNLFGLFLLLFISLPVSSFASVKIGDLYYNLDDTNRTAEVTYEEYYSYENYSNLSNTFIIPNKVIFIGIDYTVTKIGDLAFFWCKSLINVTIPDSAKEIGEGAFSLCENLLAINVEEGNQYFKSDSGILYNQDYTNLIQCPGGKQGEIIIPDSVREIGNYAFFRCERLTDIEIPNSVITIGNRAFYGCHGLTSVEIPNSVTEIGGFAFSDCNGLTSVEIPNSVTEIGDSAFSSCDMLTSVEIPNSVKEIGEKAFSFCDNLLAINVEDTNQYYKSDSGILYSKDFTILLQCPGGKQGEVIIPDSVLEIGNSAFEGCSGLTRIEIPNSVISIGTFAFHWCNCLTNIYIPNSISYINEGAFCNCANLRSIEIPNSVTSIDSWAFDNCDALESIYNYSIQPQSIDATVFSGVNINSVTLYVPEESVDLYKTAEVWKEFNIIGISGSETIENPVKIGDLHYNLDIKTKTAEVTYEIFTWGPVGNYSYLSGNLTIPNTIEYNGIEYSVTSIGNRAFYGCNGLTSINIPGSVKEIGEEAFSFCSHLLEIIVEEGNQCFKSDSGILYNQDYTTLIKCPGGKQGEVIIPDSVIEIGNEAFEGCYNLSSVIIPHSVKTIGDFAFYSCDGLTSITIPNSVTYIGDYIFHSCYGLTSVEISNSLTEIPDYAFSGCSSLKNVNIPNSVTEIGEGSFSGCEVMTRVIIPNSVTQISKYAFSYCSSLAYVFNYALKPQVIDSSVFSEVITKSIFLFVPEEYEDLYKVADVWKEFNIFGFSDNSKFVNHVKIDDLYYNLLGNKTAEVTYESDSMDNYSYLKGNLTIPGIVEYEGIEYSVISIGNSAFQYCKELTNVTIPNSVMTIAFKAFLGCKGLTSVEIPNSVNSFGNYAFYACSGLQTFYNYAPHPQDIDASLFYGMDINTAIFFVPDESMDLYKTADVWKEFNIFGFSNQFVNPVKIGDLYYNLHGDKSAEVTYEKYDSSENYYYLGNITIPSIVEYNGFEYSVTKIGIEAFAGCESLTSIEIPNSVTEIGSYAFYGCKALTNVEIPNSVTEIGSYAFYGCKALTNVEIPNSVTSIGSGAFVYCRGLTSITIPVSVKEIGSGAFSSCNSLLEINVEEGNQYYKSDSGILYNNDYTILLLCPEGKKGEVIIPDFVLEIGNAAFVGCNSLTSVIIGNSVRTIGNTTFAGCNSLTSVIIGNSVISIGDDAFEECSELKNVIFGNSLTSIGDFAFNGCESLISINLPKTLKTIGLAAFGFCYNLLEINVENGNESFKSDSGILYNHDFTSILLCPAGKKGEFVIPNSVTKIGDLAFLTCSRLVRIVLPNTVTEIGYGAFYDCSRIRTIEIPSSVKEIQGQAFFLCVSLESVYNYAEIPQNISGVFTGIDNISSITLFVPEESVDLYRSAGEWKEFNVVGYSGTGENDVKIIKSSYLYYLLDDKTMTAEVIDCDYNISEVIIPESIDYENNSYLVTAIGAAAFAACKELKSVDIPNTVTKIGIGAFSQCKKLTFINIPNSVTEIGIEAFVYCYGLTSVEIGNSVTKIGDSAFRSCSGLTSIEIPNSVTEIGEFAFSSCHMLTSVEIGNSVTEIGDYAFYGCDALESVYNLAEIPQDIDASVFDNVYINTVTLYVPEESMGLYNTAEVWKEFNIVGISNENLKTDSILGDESSDATRKVIRAGKVYILKGDKVFDTNGHEVNRKF